jgi:hypothetical protein
MHTLTRRGFSLGNTTNANPSAVDSKSQWQRGHAVLLPTMCLSDIRSYQPHIDASGQLFLAVLEQQSCDKLLAMPPYSERLDGHFESLGSTINQGDQQEIETLVFDAVKDDHIIAEDLWMKVSWLSFVEDDPSLRFRFSFGVDLAEDVAADQHRQACAARLTDAVFPESRIITNNQALHQTLQSILQTNKIQFVERIIYFNAPNGGAYLHHDLERGHAGVVYAQLSGQTYWLALPRQALLHEITEFVRQGKWPSSVTPTMQGRLRTLVEDPVALQNALSSFANDDLIHLINETAEFVQTLIKHGWGYQLESGDILLLPQENDELSCWHSVFCLGDEAGQALSFAIRAD